MASTKTKKSQEPRRLNHEPHRNLNQHAFLSIDDLPDELLLEVAKYLEGDNQALGTLTQVSRRFKFISGELLYRTINLPSSRKDNTIYLVRTLIKKPELRSKVRQLEFSASPFFTGLQTDSSANEHAALLLQISQSVYGLDLFGTENPFESQEEMFWRCALMIGMLNAVAGLLLALCNNLRILHINIHLQEHPRVPISNICKTLYFIEGDASQQAPGRWSGFTHFHIVKRLRIFGESMSILQLPFYSLRVLEIDLWREYITTHAAGAEHDFFDNSVAECILPPYPNIDTLIVRSDWDELNIETHQSDDEQLPLLLYNLPQSAITHFEMLFVRSPTAVRHWRGSFEHITRALIAAENVYPSLEYLKIDYEVSDHFDPRRCFGGCANVPDLHSFLKLTKMDVLQGVLLYEARNTLNKRRYFCGIMPPPNLESLTVICPTVAIFGWLDILADQKTDAPHLSKITLLCRCGYGAGPKEFEGDIATCSFEKLKKLGVEVRVVEEKLGAFEAQARKEGSVWEADWAEDGWAECLFGEGEG